MDINWYPGHMAKTKRLIQENLNLIDIVYEIIDARIPYSSKIIDIDNLIKNKPRILIMTKSDLCDMNITSKWIKYYEAKGYKVITLNLLSNDKLDIITDITKEVMQEYDEKRIKKGLKLRSYRALVVGIPNVGKSTFINKLVGRKATKVGNMPGITKQLGWIKANKDIELLDSPGILWPKLEEQEVALNLAATSAIKEEILPIHDVAYHILKKLNDNYKDKLIERYGIDNIDDIDEVYNAIGKKRGCLVKGGEVDYTKVSTLIIRDMRDGYLSNITLDRI